LVLVEVLEVVAVLLAIKQMELILHLAHSQQLLVVVVVLVMQLAEVPQMVILVVQAVVQMHLVMQVVLQVVRRLLVKVTKVEM
jgi:hypothetical protein